MQSIAIYRLYLSVGLSPGNNPSPARAGFFIGGSSINHVVFMLEVLLKYHLIFLSNDIVNINLAKKKSEMVFCVG